MRAAPPSAESPPLAKIPGVSLHRQLYLVLRDRIVRGQFKAGDALPAEDALCDMFGISRITVRRTLADLARDGYIERRHGLGTFVLDGASLPRPQATLTFLEGLRKTTLETEVRVLGVEHAVPPADVAEQLRLAPGERAVHALRLRHQGTTPLMVTDAWVPERVGAKVTSAALRQQALYELLLAQGIKFGRVVQEITAQSAELPVAGWLQVPVGTPLLVLFRLIHDRTLHPVQYLRVYLSSERSRILMDIAGTDINTLTAGQIVHDTNRSR